LGFLEKNDAFDFNVALQDHVKYTKQSKNVNSKFANQPKLDLSLKEGQTITVNIKTKTGAPVTSTKSQTSASNPVPFLRPPPSGKVSHFQTQPTGLAPPSNVNVDQYGQQNTSTPSADLWGDFVTSTPNQTPAPQQFNNANYSMSINTNTNNPNNPFGISTDNQLPTLTPTAPKQPAQNNNPFAGLVQMPQSGTQPQQGQAWFSQPTQPAQGQNPWFLQNQSTTNQTTQPTQQSGTQPMQPWFI